MNEYDIKFEKVFDELYDKYINNFQMKEEGKVNKRRTNIGAISLAIAVMGFMFSYVFLVVYMDNVSYKNILLIFIILVIISIILSIVGIYFIKNRKSSNKNRFIKDFIKELFSNLNYLIDSKEKTQNFYNNFLNSQLNISKATVIYVNDFVFGEIDSIKLESCYVNEICPNYVNNSSDVISSLFVHIKLDYIKKLKLFISSSEMLKKYINIISLDNDTFNSMFSTTAESKSDISMILTPDIMDLLIELRKERKFDMSIINDNIYFKFYSANIFELISYDKNEMKRNFYSYYQLMNSVMDLAMKINKIYKDI